VTLPLISIVVNVYNGERYLGECLDSILALKADQPFEVIVADDGSTDATEAIVRRYDDPRIVNARLAQNVGAAAAVNHAFSLVRGEFAARIDYDDRYHPDFLTDSFGALERYPDAAFVCGAIRMIDANGIPGVQTGPADYGEEPGCRDRFRSMLTRHFVTAPTILGRTCHWRRAIPIPMGMNFFDWYMNLTMAESAPVAVIDKVTADYRVHPLNMHTTKVRDGMGERVTFEVLDRFLDRSPRSSELSPNAACIRALHYVDWGNKYFGAGMNTDALRCYRRALRHDPRQVWQGGFMHRLTGLLIGRERYESIKARLPRAVR
jgi:glycosyltransferase involved in cell wall biosynthesis